MVAAMRTVIVSVCIVGAITATLHTASACSCASFEDGAWDMARESDTIVVVTFTGVAECAFPPPSEGCRDELIEGEVVETVKGRVQPGRRVLVPGTLGEPESVDREHGFHFSSSACERMRFAENQPEASNRHLLFLESSDERPRRILRERRMVPRAPGDGPFFERVATCQQPNAEPITGTDDPWYRFVKAVAAAQSHTPPLDHEEFLESIVDDPSWLIRREAYLGHRSIEFRKNGVLDPDPRIRRLAGRSLYGPMLQALRSAATTYRRNHGRWPQPDEISALTDLLPNGHSSQLAAGVAADPWGNPYLLRRCPPEGAPPRGCEFVSIGPDHVAGTRDDFSSLELTDDIALFDSD